MDWTESRQDSPLHSNAKVAMESEATHATTATTSATTSWLSSTNWTVAGGSLENSVAFESSLSPIDDEEAETTASKAPLILRPDSSDSGPCEIKISFTQKHEVRQVYIRSTARVYEIYYNSGLQSDTEYLCTVRCGIAARDEEVLTTDIEEVFSTDLSAPNKSLNEELKTISNSTSSEDDWVEVKASDTPAVENKKLSLTSGSDSNARRSKQELYEATAQITDSSPCTSLTLRLLSLQSKGCVYVDEVYVFADLVDSADSEDQEGQVGNSAGSSLMAMLAPTLLQLSKTTRPSTDTMEKQKLPQFGSKSTEPVNSATNHLERKSSVTDHEEVNVAGAGPAQVQPPRVPVSENKPDNNSFGYIERSMDQLVSRMSRIEDLCLRFEENMLKPISSIETRLQKVEEQLELLTKKTHNTELPSCSRIIAPEFSCNDSDSNSFYNSSIDHPLCGSFESDKKVFHSDVIPVPPDGTSFSVNATLLVPSLIVTAPEFSNGDDAEENLLSESGTVSSKDKPRQALSIDDALASALAGLMSSTSMRPPKYTQTLAVKAPEFSNEDEKDDTKALPSAYCEIAAAHPISCQKTDETECLEAPTASNSSLETEGNAIRSNDDYSEKTAESGDEDCWHRDGGEGDHQDRGTDTIVEGDVTRTESNQISDENANEEASEESSNISVLCITGISDETEKKEETSASSELAEAAENTKPGSEILQEVLAFSCASSAVDFEIPVLDVKFAPQESSSSKATLEALLADVQESNVESPCIKDDHDPPVDEQCNLISVEEIESVAPVGDGPLSLDMNYCNLMDMPLILESESLQDRQDHPTCCSHEISASSLI